VTLKEIVNNWKINNTDTDKSNKNAKKNVHLQQTPSTSTCPDKHAHNPLTQVAPFEQVEPPVVFAHGSPMPDPSERFSMSHLVMPFAF